MTATLSPPVGRHGRAHLSRFASPTATGIAAGIAAALIWSTFMLFAKSGTTGGLLPQDFAALRFGTAALVMLPWLLRHDPRRLGGIGWRRAAVLTLLAGPLFILLATGGYAHAPLAHGAVIQPSTIALASMLVAALLLKERITRARLGGIALILAGLALIASHAEAMGGVMVWIGDLMFIAAGFGWTGFTILIKRWELDPLAVTAAVSTLSAALVFSAMLATGDFDRIAALPPATLLAQVIVQGLAAGVIAVIAYGRAVRILGAGRAGLFPAIVPALTLLLGALWSGTPPQFFEIAGAMLATLGLVVAVGLHRPASVPPCCRRSPAMTHDPLFEPIRYGAIEAPNRIVMAPLTRTRANAEDAPHELQQTYYTQRSTAGLIISEATHISPQGKGYAGAPGIYSDKQIEGWRGVTEAVHAAGGRMMLQLWHVGRLSHPSLQPGGALPVAPSAVGLQGHAFTYEGPQDFVVPRALETDEIPGIIEDYRRAAINAKAAGFDGVEVHSANAYLLDQFLRDGTNHRTDRYGGSIENRTRLTLEVTDAVVSVWGADRVGIRLSPSLTINGMSDSNPAPLFGYLAEQLGKRGLAYLHCVEPSDPRGDPFDRIVDPQVVRKAFGGNYIANGSYTGPRARAALAAGEIDAASFGRLFIANPDLPRRLAEDLPMNPLNAARIYSGGGDGYIDYPFAD